MLLFLHELGFMFGNFIGKDMNLTLIVWAVAHEPFVCTYVSEIDAIELGHGFQRYPAIFQYIGAPIGKVQSLDPEHLAQVRVFQLGGDGWRRQCLLCLNEVVVIGVASCFDLDS